MQDLFAGQPVNIPAMLARLKQVARELETAHTWGTQMLGRIIAPVPRRELLDLCLAATVRALTDGS